MKNIYKSLIVLILVLNISQLEAQTNNINFTLTSESITVLDKTQAITSTIIKTDTTLSWTQQANGNTDTMTFSIQSTSGNWDSTTGLGEIVFNMTLANYECILTMTGQEEGVSAVLSFVEFNKEQGDYLFNISNITYQ